MVVLCSVSACRIHAMPGSLSANRFPLREAQRQRAG